MAILEKGYIGSGAAGRNTTIIRANYRTPEGEFYKESVKLYEGLAPTSTSTSSSRSRPGRFGRTPTAGSSPRTSARSQPAPRHRLARDLPDEIAELCPEMDLSEDVTWPVVAALYHPPGGIIRHDAVVWAKRAAPTGRESRSIRTRR